MLKLQPDERVLDVGCGIGQLPHLDLLATLRLPWTPCVIHDFCKCCASVPVFYKGISCWRGVERAHVHCSVRIFACRACA